MLPKSVTGDLNMYQGGLLAIPLQRKGAHVGLWGNSISADDELTVLLALVATYDAYCIYSSLCACYSRSSS